MAAKAKSEPTTTPSEEVNTSAPTAGRIHVHGLNIVGYGTGTAKDPICARLPISAVQVDKEHNPRRVILKENIEELAASIKANGLLEPVVVRPNPESSKKFLLVAGEQRLRACKLNEMAEIDVRIRTDEMDRWDAKAIAVVENDKRTGLSALEMGYAFKEMVGAGKDIKAIARVIGGTLNPGNGKYDKERTVRRCIELAGLDPDTQKLLTDDEVSPRAALELGKLDDAMRSAVVQNLREGSQQLTEEAIRATAKQLARAGEDAVSAQPSQETRSAAKLVVWRGNRAATALIAALAANYAAAQGPDDRGTAQWYEWRGALAALLYLRSDLEDSTLPADDATSAADKKILALFDKLVGAEAKKGAASPEAAAEEDASCADEE